MSPRAAGDIPGSVTNVFRFRVKEGRRFLFAKRLVGAKNNLFALEVECPMIAHGAVKLLLHFTEHSIDEGSRVLESQFLFLSEDSPSRRIDHIPWELHLVEFGNRERRPDFGESAVTWRAFAVHPR